MLVSGMICRTKHNRDATHPASVHRMRFHLEPDRLWSDMLISVIVKSYQRPFLLRVCLESIQKYWGPRNEYEVIVADDGTRPELLDRFEDRFGGELYDRFVHSTTGEEKWELCKQGKFSRVIPTCGSTWNDAQAIAKGEIIFLIEDDSYLIRPMSHVACADALQIRPETLCLIGLKERLELDIHGVQERGRVLEALKDEETSLIGTHLNSGVVEQEVFALLKHPVWPWSFDGIFYRAADWKTIGDWPLMVSTGPMEGFVQGRLRDLGWTDRHYGMSRHPFCGFDGYTSVRTDQANYLGRFRHVDAINAAWMDGSFDPCFEDVVRGRLTWDQSRTGAPIQLHYPRHLRQINFVTGHELCGELRGHEADARWLAEANQQAMLYGETLLESVPESCRST